jgi:hypothetical protein
MSRRDVAMLAGLSVLGFGLLLPAVAKSQNDASAKKNINKLKKIGIGFMQASDNTMNSIPHNGGCDEAASFPKINYGWHTPIDPPGSRIGGLFVGTWATMIADFVELGGVMKKTNFDKMMATAPPTTYPDEANWNLNSHVYMCDERKRQGYRSHKNAAGYDGLLTDFAVNAFVNSPAVSYGFPESGYAAGIMQTKCYGDWAAASSRIRIDIIRDGSSNTILVGQKALPPDADLKKVDFKGDEGIFSPGNWSIEKSKKKWGSTGTARGHVCVKNPPKEEPKEYTDGVPWMFRDSELAKDPKNYEMAWGSPFAEGVPFMFGDGTVRFIKYSQRGTVNFARMLYPDDGMVIVND